MEHNDVFLYLIKHIGNFDLVMFAGDREIQCWAQVSLTQVFGSNDSYFARIWSILCEFC